MKWYFLLKGWDIRYSELHGMYVLWYQEREVARVHNDERSVIVFKQVICQVAARYSTKLTENFSDMPEDRVVIADKTWEPTTLKILRKRAAEGTLTDEAG